MSSFKRLREEVREVRKVREGKVREERIRRVKTVRRLRGTYQEPMSQEPACRGQMSQEPVPNS